MTIQIENRELFKKNLKKCSKCNKTLNISNFSYSKLGQFNLRSTCTECDKIIYSDYRLNHLEYYKELARKRRREKAEDCRNWDRRYREIYHKSLKGKSSKLYSSAKRRAKLRNIEFTITSEWVLDKLSKGICEETGFKLDFKPSNFRVSPMCPTLDREDNSKGYTPENTKIVCWWWNLSKADWTKEELITFITNYYNNNIKK